jgi:hypothetical protein
VFQGNLYFTKDIADDSFVSRNKKPKPIPKPAPKPAPKGKHVQLFKMRHNVGKGFVAQLLMMGSEDVHNVLKFACTLCYGTLLQRLWLGSGGALSAVYVQCSYLGIWPWDSSGGT